MTKGESTRRKIIAEAAPIFNRFGYAGCSMRDIMEATGLEKGGLYRHFATKEKLATEVFRYSLALVVEVRRDGVEKIRGAVEQLRYLIRHFVEIHSIIPGGCPVMNTAIDADDGNPTLRALVQEAMRQWKATLGRIVKEGIEQGEIETNIEPRSIANVIISTLEGALMISRLEGTRVAMHDAQSMLEKILHDIESTSVRNELHKPGARPQEGRRRNQKS
jgi:AcrR family transcriptional regulator